MRRLDRVAREEAVAASRIKSALGGRRDRRTRARRLAWAEEEAARAIQASVVTRTARLAVARRRRDTEDEAATRLQSPLRGREAKQKAARHLAPRAVEVAREAAARQINASIRASREGTKARRYHQRRRTLVEAEWQRDEEVAIAAEPDVQRIYNEFHTVLTPELCHRLHEAERITRFLVLARASCQWWRDWALSRALFTVY